MLGHPAHVHGARGGDAARGGSSAGPRPPRPRRATAAPLNTAPGTVPGVRGIRWRRASLAAAVALLLLLLALYALDRAGGHARASDAYAALALALIAGAVAA